VRALTFVREGGAARPHSPETQRLLRKLDEAQALLRGLDREAAPDQPADQASSPKEPHSPTRDEGAADDEGPAGPAADAAPVSQALVRQDAAARGSAAGGEMRSARYAVAANQVAAALSGAAGRLAKLGMERGGLERLAAHLQVGTCDHGLVGRLCTRCAHWSVGQAAPYAGLANTVDTRPLYSVFLKYNESYTVFGRIATAFPAAQAAAKLASCPTNPARASSHGHIETIRQGRWRRRRA
jgi:hypothetical protein